jgi:hypothetical protein
MDMKWVLFSHVWNHFNTNGSLLLGMPPPFVYRIQLTFEVPGPWIVRRVVPHKSITMIVLKASSLLLQVVVVAVVICSFCNSEYKNARGLRTHHQHNPMCRAQFFYTSHRCQATTDSSHDDSAESDGSFDEMSVISYDAVTITGIQSNDGSGYTLYRSAAARPFVGCGTTHCSWWGEAQFHCNALVECCQAYWNQFVAGRTDGIEGVKSGYTSTDEDTDDSSSDCQFPLKVTLKYITSNFPISFSS